MTTRFIYQRKGLTLAQNAVDLLTDCPSRERAGWLSDAWFSSVAERLFTGGNQAEKAFLDNYAKSHKDGLPEGMVAMCYPSDFLEGTYIPNWSLWEHNGIYASCNHGFAAYAMKWIVDALTGYDCMGTCKAEEKGLGIDCKIRIPKDIHGEEYVTLCVKNNIVTMG